MSTPEQTPYLPPPAYPVGSEPGSDAAQLSRRERRQRARDEAALRRLSMGWTRRQDRTLTQTERRVLRRNGRKVEHPHEAMRRFAARLREKPLPTIVMPSRTDRRPHPDVMGASAHSEGSSRG